MKELSTQWLTALYDNLRGRPEVLVNGFKEAGIVEALEKQYEEEEVDDRVTPIIRSVIRIGPIFVVLVSVRYRNREVFFPITPRDRDRTLSTRVVLSIACYSCSSQLPATLVRLNCLLLLSFATPVVCPHCLLLLLFATPVVCLILLFILSRCSSPVFVFIVRRSSLVVRLTMKSVIV